MFKRSLPLLLAAALFPTVPALAAATHHLSGTVTGSDGRPVAHASVKLQNTKTNQVTSRLTNRAGHFRFNRIPTDTGFTIWATDRQATSDHKNITRFDNNKDLTVDLSLPTN